MEKTQGILKKSRERGGEGEGTEKEEVRGRRGKKGRTVGGGKGWMARMDGSYCDKDEQKISKNIFSKVWSSQNFDFARTFVQNMKLSRFFSEYFAGILFLSNARKFLKLVKSSKLVNF